MRFVGIDVAAERHVVATVDEAGTLLGHYWKNLFAALVARGFAVALLNPRRPHRFAGEDLQRTQTDAINPASAPRCARA